MTSFFPIALGIGLQGRVTSFFPIALGIGLQGRVLTVCFPCAVRLQRWKVQSKMFPRRFGAVQPDRGLLDVQRQNQPPEKHLDCELYHSSLKQTNRPTDRQTNNRTVRDRNVVDGLYRINSFYRVRAFLLDPSSSPPPPPPHTHTHLCRR